MHVQHVVAVNLVTDLADNIWFVIVFAIVSKIVDKRIAGIHITLLASLVNMSQFMHKFYIFTLVDKFGIFIPSGVIAIICFLLSIFFWNKMYELDD
jgi:Na+-translocating ferredoxin:NAD+ oxidoreductase RnfE subunit